ncbi:MAG: NAD-dependent succinate-semialdehyde dehydrogenase [Cytophagales bacterium]|nr:NAD-dependent succinate-semialdehyde dehydrogenase [Cytophagales bacterium]
MTERNFSECEEERVEAVLPKCVELDSLEEAKAKLERAHQQQKCWRKFTMKERAEALAELAQELRAKKAELSRMIVLEMGKKISEAEEEIEKCAALAEYYAENSDRILAVKPVKTKASESYVKFEPLGTVLAIMPWNFPFWQALRFALPALMAGNSVVLKHAENVFGCSEKMFELFDSLKKAPKGIFQSVHVKAPQVEEIIADPRIHFVAFTGSDATGALVASMAGKHLKKTVMELGGSDALIVLEDADVKRCAQEAFRARLRNSGQTCTAPKRMIVHESAYDEFVSELQRLFSEVKVGSPWDENSDCTGLAKTEILQELDKMVGISAGMGAEVLAGGEILSLEEKTYAPTLLTEVRPEMPVFTHETFGPVAAVLRAGSAEEAVDLANQSKYGLSASVWSEDVAKAKALISKLEVGSVYINSVTRSVPELPFGGVKRSGYGRELSAFGMREFVNIKTVFVK